jgi:hypothetical protein
MFSVHMFQFTIIFKVSQVNHFRNRMETCRQKIYWKLLSCCKSEKLIPKICTPILVRHVRELLKRARYTCNGCAKTSCVTLAENCYVKHRNNFIFEPVCLFQIIFCLFGVAHYFF